MKTKIILIFSAVLTLTACLGPKIPETPKMPKFEPSKYEIPEDMKVRLAESGKKLMQSLARLSRSSYFSSLIFNSEIKYPIYTGSGVWSRLENGEPDRGYRVQLTLTLLNQFSFTYIEFAKGEGNIVYSTEINGDYWTRNEIMHLEGLGFIVAGQNSDFLLLTLTKSLNDLPPMGTVELSSSQKSPARSYNVAVSQVSSNALSVLKHFNGNEIKGYDFSAENECQLKVTNEKEVLKFEITQALGKKGNFTISPKSTIFAFNQGFTSIHTLLANDRGHVANLSIMVFEGKIHSVTIAKPKGPEDPGLSDQSSCWFN